VDLYSKILGWESKFVDYILDPIYGQIGITSFEKEVIETEVFSRLRNIKQLGFINKIFPSATHTRYEHSIGTLSITWDILKGFIKMFEDNDETEILDIFSNEVLQSVRLAALLHDIGHGPFSHAIEKTLEELEYSYDHDKLSSYLLSYKIPINSQKSLNLNFDTKLKSTLLRKYRKELSFINKKNRDIILSIFDLDYVPFSINENFEKIRFFLYEILKGDIGSDRIDYLLRDTYFTGLGHKFSLSEILVNLCYIHDNVNDRILLSVESEGKESVELMLLTRYFHYEFIANHPVNVKYISKLNYMIKKLINEKFTKSYTNKIKEYLIDLALKNDWIEAELNDDTKFIKAYNLTLLDINNYTERYWFYRIIEDVNLRNIYELKVKNFISDKLGENINDKILFYYNVGKPRIPIIHYYMDSYIQGENWKSTLVHDNSPFLISLGKAYIGNTYMIMYVPEEYDEQIQNIFRIYPDFPKKMSFLNDVIDSIKYDWINYHDLLIFVFILLDRQYGYSKIKNIGYIIDEYKKMKRKIDDTYDYKIYNKCYDHEENKIFDYPKEVINGLQLLEVCNFIDIEIINRNSIIKEGKRVYKPSYEFTIKKIIYKVGRDFKPITQAYYKYPQRSIRDKFVTI